MEYDEIKNKPIEKLARVNFSVVDNNTFIHKIASSCLYIYSAIGDRFGLLLDDQDAIMGKLDDEY